MFNFCDLSGDRCLVDTLSFLKEYTSLKKGYTITEHQRLEFESVPNSPYDETATGSWKFRFTSSSIRKRMQTEIRLILLKRRNVQYHLGCWEWESR